MEENKKTKTVLVLVELPWGRDKDPRVPLGHASLLSKIKLDDDIKVYSVVHPVNSSDFDCKKVFNEIIGLVKKNKDSRIDLAFGVYVWSEDIIQRLLLMINMSDFNGRIILGGPQISYSGEGLEKHYPNADIFIRGYGEFALSSLVKSKKPIKIPGVHYAGEKDLLLQASVNLDLLPSPWTNGVINIQGQGFIRWESQRGCPFKCSFCQHKEAGARLVNRQLSPCRIRDEIDLFCSNDVKDIAILDPIFNSTSLSIKILQRFIDNKYSGRLSLQCRAEMVTEEFIQLVSKLDVRLEFGLQTIHNKEGKAVRRMNNIKKVDQVIKKVNKAGIDYEVSLIYGLPEQTLKSFYQTISWCLIRSVPVIKAFPLMLLRGTGVEQEREKWGLIESKGSMPVVLQSDTFTYNDWHKMAQISEALKHTEGKHPSTIKGLKKISQVMQVDHSRYRPDSSLINEHRNVA